MLSLLQNKTIGILETLVTTLEQYEDVQKRPRVFAKNELHSNENQDMAAENSSDDVDDAGSSDQAPKDKFKHLSFELIDIGLFQGQKGLDYLKQSPAYTMTDKFIHYDKQIKTVKDQSVKLYSFLNDKIYFPLKNNLVVFYDQGSNMITFMVKILQEHQGKVMDYIKEHYSNVRVMIKDNWMKLDFNHDGKVSMEDLRKGVHDLYDFMINYDYLQRAVEIKSTLYQDALKYMQKDLNQEGRKKESRLSDDSKVDNLLKED